MKNRLKTISAEIKTPAFLYSQPFHLAQIKKFLQKANDLKTAIYYSVKTNDSVFLLEEIAKHVTGMEVISLRELELVSSMNDVNKIIVNGPCKTEQFLNKAIECGAYIYIDNEHEFQRLVSILKEKNQRIDAGLRLMYGNNLHDSKFGINTNSSFYNHLLLKKDDYNAHINITGLHSHVSSYEESNDDFHARVSDMKKRADEFEKNGFSINYINIGGGYDPIVRLKAWMEWEPLNDFDHKMALLKDVFLSEPDFFREKTLIMEPGRALSEGAIVGIGEVVTIKSLNEVTYVFMDFSTAFAGGSHPAESCINMVALERGTGKVYPLKKDNQSKTLLCGPLCSGSDNFGFYSGKSFSVGDRILLLNAGAYSLSFRWHGPEKLPDITYFCEELI